MAILAKRLLDPCSASAVTAPAVVYSSRFTPSSSEGGFSRKPPCCSCLRTSATTTAVLAVFATSVVGAWEPVGGKAGAAAPGAPAVETGKIAGGFGVGLLRGRFVVVVAAKVADVLPCGLSFGVLRACVDLGGADTPLFRPISFFDRLLAGIFWTATFLLPIVCKC